MYSTKYSTVHVLYRYFFYGFEKEREIAFENTVQSLAEFTKKYLTNLLDNLQPVL